MSDCETIEETTLAEFGGLELGREMTRRMVDARHKSVFHGNSAWILDPSDAARVATIFILEVRRLERRMATEAIEAAREEERTRIKAEVLAAVFAEGAEHCYSAESGDWLYGHDAACAGIKAAIELATKQEPT